MQNKKTSIILTIIAVLLFVAVSIFFLYQPTGNKITNNIFKTKQKCSYKNNEDAYKKAIENKDIAICSCILEDEYLSDVCKDVTYELSLYDQALSQGNAQLCNNIKEEERKQACIGTVQSKIDYLNKKDPEELANMYTAVHNNEKAIEQLEILVKEDATNVTNLIQLALNYAGKALSEQEQGNEQKTYIAKAFKAIEKAKEIDENNSEVYRVEGYIYEIQPDIVKAIQSYNKAIELDEKNILAYVGRGHANRIIGLLEISLEDLQKASKLDEDNKEITIYTNLCNLQKSKGDINKAIKNCNIVINANHPDPVFTSGAYQLLSQMYIQKKEYQKAEGYLMQASSLTPNDANLFVTVATLNIHQKKYDKAVKNATKALELSPMKVAAFLILSQSLYMQENYNDSIMIAQKGLKLVDDDVSLLSSSKISTKRDLYYSIANSYRELNNVQKQSEYEQKAKDISNIK